MCICTLCQYCQLQFIKFYTFFPLGHCVVKQSGGRINAKDGKAKFPSKQSQLSLNKFIRDIFEEG